MSKRILAICLIVCVIFLLHSGIVLAVGLCEPCTVADGQQGECDAGLVCMGKKCHPACPGGKVCIQNPLNACSFQDLVDNITNFIFYIALALVPLMVLIGAFFLLTAGGDPKRIQTGQKTILYTVIGLAIILFAKGFVAIIKHIL